MKEDITNSVQRAKVAILVGAKGRGSNMVALATACQSGEVPADITTVISPKADTPAVEAAQELKLNTEIIGPEPLDTYGPRLLQALKDTVFICLAGYTRLLPVEITQAFPNRILNVHPALLPKYGGKGMYGSKVHEAVLASDDTESGCTVHFVNERYDEGAIILQRRVPRLAGDTAETLAERVLAQEHLAYAEALTKVIHETGS